MRVTVIANCQARPVADYLRLLGRDVEIVDIIITHLAKESDAARLESAAANSDFIFAQLVQPNYPIELVRSSTLKERYGDRVLLWPNIFFKGQTPDLCYITAASGARVVGPLGDYHSRPLMDAFLAGQSVENAERGLLQGDFDTSGLTDLVDSSLDELRRREQLCEVGVTDLIAEFWRERRCFFTFNHPAAELMLAVAGRLLSRADKPPKLVLQGSHVGEPLSPFVPPTWPAIADALQLKFPTSTSSRGVPVAFPGGRTLLGSGAAYYSSIDLVKMFFHCYEAQRNLLSSCRIT